MESEAIFFPLVPSLGGTDVPCGLSRALSLFIIHPEDTIGFWSLQHADLFAYFDVLICVHISASWLDLLYPPILLCEPC